MLRYRPLLTNELIEPVFCDGAETVPRDGHAIQSRSASAPDAAECVAIMTLLRLKDERSLTLQGDEPFQLLGWDWFAAPGVHHRDPRCIAGHTSEGTEGDRDGQPKALPTLSAAARAAGGSIPGVSWQEVGHASILRGPAHKVRWYTSRRRSQACIRK